MTCAAPKGERIKAWLFRLYYLMYEVGVNMNKMLKPHWVYVFIELKILSRFFLPWAKNHT